MIPYDKMNKKQKREEDNKKRGRWEISPVSRVVPSKKRYSRKKKHKNQEEG